jgi:hypothetical protein
MHLRLHPVTGRLDLSNMTFSWFFVPLIAHALDAGDRFPAFPAAEPRTAQWIQAVAHIIPTIPGGPHTWQTVRQGMDYVPADFQDAVQDALVNSGHTQLLNAMNSYAVALAEAYL